ncbi:MAG: hypothetical protein WAU86_09335 [Oricola sp.]
MCDRCELDMLMYGEPVKHEPPVWEKGRFQAKAVQDGPESAAGGEAASPDTEKNEAESRKTARTAREQES